MSFDEKGEFMIDKIVKFLEVYWQRCKLFQSLHKYQFILFARLYYPQFKSIAQANAALVKISAHSEKNETLGEFDESF